MIFKKLLENLEPQYQLSFVVKNSLKGYFYSEEFLRGIVDFDTITFDHIPTYEEVKETCEKLTKLVGNSFNKFNYEDLTTNNGANAEELGTKVYYTFDNLELYPLEVNNWKTDLIKTYPKVETSFEVTNNFDDTLTWDKL